MAVLSPALVVAMCSMFILTRLQHHFYIYERPLLFGLLYVLEPDPAHLLALDRLAASAAASPSNAVKAAVKLRPTAASLPLRLTAITPAFFPQDPQPYHRALSHTLSLLAATLVSAAFESLLRALAPSALANARTPHLALVTILFAVAHQARLSAALVPTRLLAAVLAVLTVPALLLTHAPAAGPLVALGAPADAAVDALRPFLESVLDPADPAAAAALAAQLVAAARVALAALAAALAAAQAVPARRITLLDARLRARYALDDATLADTPYEPARPPARAMLLVALDHAAALAAALLPPLVPGLGARPRVALALAWAAARAAAARPRLQAFLFEAGGAYREFWADRAARGTAKAAETARRTVTGTAHFVFLVAVAYAAPAVAALAAAAAAATAHPAGGFVAEAALFLSWVAVASYECFGALSLATEALFGSAQERRDAKKSAVPTPTSGSERRRQRRLVEARMREEQSAASR